MEQLLVGYITSKKNAIKRFGDLGNKTNRYIENFFHVGTHFGLQWVFFTPEDIDFDSNTVNGIIFVNGKSQKTIVEIPRIADNILLKPLKSTYSELKLRGVHLLRHFSNLTKASVDASLAKDGTYSEILLPTKDVKEFEDIIKEVDNYDSVIVKPGKGSSGIGVRRITRLGNKYQVTHNRNNFVFTHKELHDNWYTKKISDGGFVIQPFVKSVTHRGEPFDIRVSCVRGAEGLFSSKYYVRVGNPQGIVSNM